MLLAEQMQIQTQEALVRIVQEDEHRVSVLMQTIKPLMEEAANKGQYYLEVAGTVDPALQMYLEQEGFRVSCGGPRGNPEYAIGWSVKDCLPQPKVE